MNIKRPEQTTRSNTTQASKQATNNKETTTIQTHKSENAQHEQLKGSIDCNKITTHTYLAAANK